MTPSEQRFDDVTAQLAAYGGKVRGWTLNPESTATSDEILESKAKFLEAFLDGKYKRIFMIDTDDDNGWLHALEDAWNLADKAGEKALAVKLEEIIDHHIKLAGEYGAVST